MPNEIQQAERLFEEIEELCDRVARILTFAERAQEALSAHFKIKNKAKELQDMYRKTSLEDIHAILVKVKAKHETLLKDNLGINDEGCKKLIIRDDSLAHMQYLKERDKISPDPVVQKAVLKGKGEVNGTDK